MDIIAFYLRLSLADGDLGKNNKDESNSIENQRLLLQSFVESMDELDGEIKEYIDDGYSGTNFNRPAFQEMIEDAKKGKIDVLLVKDLSRLGTIYVHYYSVKMGFIWNSWHGSYECDYRSCIWFHCCNRDCSTSSLVCNYISSECFNTKGAK